MHPNEKIEIKRVKKSNKINKIIKQLLPTIITFAIGYLTNYFNCSLSWFTTALTLLFFQKLWTFNRNTDNFVNCNERVFITNKFKDEELPSWVTFPDMVSSTLVLLKDYTEGPWLARISLKEQTISGWI